eukprot:5424632-Alexandrium_andersonii.AAC.1
MSGTRRIPVSGAITSRTRGSAGRPHTWGTCLAFAWKRVRRVPTLASASASTAWSSRGTAS